MNITGRAKITGLVLISLFIICCDSINRNNGSSEDGPPTVVSETPDNDTTNIAKNTLIAAVFSEDMNADTINASTFMVNDGAISGTVYYNSSNRKATFTPSAPLDYLTEYTVTVTSGAQDACGNALEDSYSWSFTTQSETSFKGWNVDASNTGLKGDYSGLTNFDVSAGGADYGKAAYSDGYLTINGNQTIENKIITWSLYCDISAGNITFRNCLFQPTGQAHGMPLVGAGAATLIEDCEIDGSLVPDADIVYAIGVSTPGSIYRCDIHHCATGIYIVNHGDDTSVAEGNYIHDLRYISPAHMDGITVRGSDGAGGTSIINNRAIVGSVACTGAFFSQPFNSLIDNMTVEGNLFEGYGINLCIDNHGSGYGSSVVIINNRMNPYPGGLGAFSVDPASSVTFAQFSENYIYDSEAADSKGAAVTYP